MKALITSLFALQVWGNFAQAADILLAECSGRTYRHRIYVLNEGTPSLNSFRYERRTYFGDSLQEAFPLQFEEIDFFEKKFTFVSFERGAIFAITATDQKKFLAGQPGRQSSAYNYRRPDSGAPLDYTGNCWLDFDRAITLPARLPNP